jgi:hypothetical protein
LADGIPCKYCGYQETEHYLSVLWIEDENKIVEKRIISLKDCVAGKGYYPDPEFKKED